MFSQEECEALRRLTDGVIPMGWLAVHCGPAIGQLSVAIVECRFRSPNPEVPDRYAQVCIHLKEYLETPRLDFPDLIRRRFNVRLKPSELVCL